MKKRLIIILVVCVFVFCIFAGGAFSAVAKKSADNPKWMRHISEDKVPSEIFRMPAQPMYGYPTQGIQYTGNCLDIHPDSIPNYPSPGQTFYIVPIAHQQIGDTWYDYQKNGSVGRMISVTNNGYAYSSWHYTNHVYPPGPRSVRFTNEWPDHSFLTTVDTTDPGPGAGNSGYCNVTHLHNGTPVVIYHETAEGARASVIAAADNEGSTNFSRHWDIPDYIDDAVPDAPLFWPKAQAQYDSATNRNYIHVVGTDGATTSPPHKVAYERCYINPADGTQLICQTFQGGQTRSYALNNNEIINPVNYPISSLSASCVISPVVAVSPVSKKVAMVWLTPAVDGDCGYFSNVSYVESQNSGNDWIAGTPWPPTPIPITFWTTTGTERAFNDVSACYDYNDNLNILYLTVGFDPANPGLYQPGTARLYHWSQSTGTSLVTTAIWGGTNPGSYNANIAKIQISAKDPIYHPDSTYLYATWSQFNQNDNNAAGTYTNSEIYGAVSRDGGEFWGRAVDLTGTHTPGCAAGNCLSEHWSSLASNMYNGDLYLQYICDEDPGGAVLGEGAWRDDPVMKLVLPEWPYVGGCRSGYIIVSPSNWTDPPLKVAPNGSRQLTLKLYNIIGGGTCTWQASGDGICVTGSYSGVLAPRDTTLSLTFTVSGSGACNGKFICGHVILTTDEAGGKTDSIPVYAVVANDYYECPNVPETVDTLQNGVLWLYTNANCEEVIYDTGASATRPDTSYQVFFEESNIIATTQGTDTIVGRFVNLNITTKEGCAGVRDKLYTVECDVDWEPDFWLVYTKNIYIMPPVPACEEINTLPWYWWEKSKQIKFFKETAPDAYKHIVIEYATVKRHNAPTWWPNQTSPGAYPNTYIGVMADIDCPFDTIRLDQLENGANKAGYETDKDIAWQRGFDWTGAHPTYNGYYCGIALANGGRPEESTVPYGAFNVKCHEHLYPNNGWGWKEGDLYRLAADPLPANIENGPAEEDSAVDRAWVFTARQIPAGNDPNASYSFTVVKVMAAGSDPVTGLALLREYVDTARAIVTREKSHGIPVICGDCNEDGVVNLGDIVCMITYTYKDGAISCPISRVDVNSSGGLPGLGDVVYLISYVYRGGPAPFCFGFY
jgi:hypothetical protein